MNPTRTRLLFRVAALFNVAAVLVGLPQLGIGRMMGMSPVPSGTFFEYVALGAILLFGVGYWMAASAPDKYRAIIQFGLAGKLVVVALAVTYCIAGAANLQFLGMVCGDLIFSFLFAWHLTSTKTRSVSAS